MTGVGAAYLRAVRQRFGEMKRVAEMATAQLQNQELLWSPHDEANSIAVLVKPAAGLMVPSDRLTDSSSLSI